MATDAPITVREGNDETVLLTIDRVDAGDDLSTVARLELYLKDDQCLTDAEATLVLSSDDGTQMVIVARTAAQITAEAYVPGWALPGSYPRFYRLDGVSGTGARRTALFGLVTVTNL